MKARRLRLLCATLSLCAGLAACHRAPPPMAPVGVPDWLARQTLPRQLDIPVQGINPAQLRDTWGQARSQGRSHQGIDIKAPPGTPIRANTDGVVLRLSEGGAGGKAVWLLGPAGSLHYYAHLRRFAGLQVGQRIRRGQVLGEVGQTGNATMPHLHYGLQADGRRWINPYGYLR